MSNALHRAHASWLLAFGDVITLLLTFFIVVVVMNSSESNKLEQWVEAQLTQSYLTLEKKIQTEELSLLAVKREPRGILLTVRGESAFQSGSYNPTQELQAQLTKIGQLLPSIKVLSLVHDAEQAVISQALADGYQWHAEVAVLGHTDNDWVDPQSSLRNNFFLSTLRAEKVTSELKNSSGLPAEQFSISGYGQWQPLAKNDSELGKALNRRVEILITAGFKAAS